jgi:(1->4)-alpha-D-glucan 1-alpha-D-glucosylmutase
MQGYALKAAREGKQETNWSNPNETYEKALETFVAQLLDPAVSGSFLAAFAAFAERTALIGALNALSQLALKVLLPGVPDFYQGTELWDLSLVDPDNRRTVDFDARAALLAGTAPDWAGLARNWRDGRIKLTLMHALLRLRAEHIEMFTRGAYEPIEVGGPDAEHVIAFRWTHDRRELVVAVGRHFASLTNGGRHWLPVWNFKIDQLLADDYVSAMGSTMRAINSRSSAELFSPLPICVLFRA